jgi:acetyl-CoA C-acetyltransferase
MPPSPDYRPVIVGVGFCQERLEDPLAAREPLALMAAAIRDAGSDARCEALCARLESIAVLQGLWQYRNPGRLLAAELGCPGARSILADLGVLQLTPLFELCRAISEGRQHIGVVTGGEARYRALRAQITGQQVADTLESADVPPPDVYLPTPDRFATEAESRAGIQTPVELFAVIESALRHHQGLDVAAHRDRLAALYARFSEVAAGNPHAWSRAPLLPAEIRDATARNAMVAFPYTKRHCSQWNVNQAVAIVVCSQAMARELGIDPARWIHPLAAVQSRHVLCLAEQRSLFSHPGTVIAGRRAFELSGLTPEQLHAAELYSCFPSALQSFALDLGIPESVPWTVTGSMAFAGGPFNHAALEGVARMVEVLREGAPMARRGLVSNLSGIFGKQAVMILGNPAVARDFDFADVTDEVAALDAPLTVRTAYEGPARIVGYTVAYRGGEPAKAYAYCDLPDGARAVASSTDGELLRRMTASEYVGRAVAIRADGGFVETHAAAPPAHAAGVGEQATWTR